MLRCTEYGIDFRISQQLHTIWCCRCQQCLLQCLSAYCAICVVRSKNKWLLRGNESFKRLKSSNSLFGFDKVFTHMFTPTHRISWSCYSSKYDSQNELQVTRQCKTALIYPLGCSCLLYQESNSLLLNLYCSKSFLWNNHMRISTHCNDF